LKQEHAARFYSGLHAFLENFTAIGEAKAPRFTQVLTGLYTREPAMFVSLERFQKIECIFHEALGVGSDARSARVAELCDGDRSLEAEVAALLEANVEEERMYAEMHGDPAP